MATFKHISSKNADYGAAEAYLTFEHDEFTMKPTLDENGRLIPREDYRISSLNCGGEDFAVACMRANLRYEKNQKREDVKSHHYIISFDPRDGHNHSGNIHVHIVINSLRIYEVPLLPYMDISHISEHCRNITMRQGRVTPPTGLLMLKLPFCHCEEGISKVPDVGPKGIPFGAISWYHSSECIALRKHCTGRLPRRCAPRNDSTIESFIVNNLLLFVTISRKSKDISAIIRP